MTMQADVREVRCTTGNHFKFYRAYVMYDDDAGEYRTLFNWGKIGANGQYQAHGAATRSAAEFLARKKLESKLSGRGSSQYVHHSERHLDVVPEDLLEHAIVARDDNARSQQAERIKVDAHARFAADADTLIRLVSGPAGLTGEVVALRSSLQEQLDELRSRLTESEGQMELINDVVAMKASA